MNVNDYEKKVEERIETVAIAARGYSPIAMPVISGVGIIFAFYDGGSRVLQATGMNPMVAVAIATLVGIGIAVLIEGMTIATMVTEDDVRQVLGDAKDAVLDKARRNKGGMFFATLAAIFMLESGPAAISLFRGETAVDLAIFRIGLIVFPFFSRIAASTFSINQILNVSMLDKRGNARLAKAKLEIEIQAELRKKQALSDLDVDATIQEKRTKNRLKIEKLGGGKPADSVNTSVNEVETGVNASVNEVETGERSDLEIMYAMVPLYLENTQISTRAVGVKLGVSHTRIGQLLAQLVEYKVFTLSDNGRGKPKTVTPNGNLDAFLNGELQIGREGERQTA